MSTKIYGRFWFTEDYLLKKRKYFVVASVLNFRVKSLTSVRLTKAIFQKNDIFAPR